MPKFLGKMARGGGGGGGGGGCKFFRDSIFPVTPAGPIFARTEIFVTEIQSQNAINPEITRYHKLSFKLSSLMVCIL